MTTPNHISGGIVFTGVFTSLWNVNIFSNPYFLVATIFVSLLPDIDNPKSIIGKLFYPLSKWLYRKYGHRTITHSFSALIVLTLIIYIFEKINQSPVQYTQIVFFAYFGHLLLDMLTISGVPLLYPFWRNPCVIPGNPAYRITTGNLRQEGIAFFIFGFSTFFLSNLFTQGFWLTYNQQFNDITHIYREFTKSNKLYNIDYDLHHFQRNIKGKGYLVYADFQQLYIVSKDTILHLKEGQQGLKINTLKPYYTGNILSTKRENIHRISADSLNKIINDKFISYAKITATEKADVVTKEKKLHDYYFELKNEYNLFFSKSVQDTLKVSVIDNSEANQRLRYEENLLKIQQQILEKQTQIAQEETNIQTANEPYYKAVSDLKNAQYKLKHTSDSYEINELKNKIISLQKYIESNRPRDSKSLSLLRVQLKGLQDKLNRPFHYLENKKKESEKDLFFSGYFDYFVLPNN